MNESITGGDASSRISSLEAMVVAANMSLMECAIAAHQKDADRAFEVACRGIDSIRKANERSPR